MCNFLVDIPVTIWYYNYRKRDTKIQKKGDKKMTSRHYTNDRQKREEIIKKIGYGKIIKSVVVDRGHKNGPEIHNLSDTGIITIQNQRTKKMITKLIARPGQIKRYYKENEIIPSGLLDLARQHQKLALNFA